MITYGYVKSHTYTNDGTLYVKVRIPSVHGPYHKSDAKGKTIRNYVPDDRLPEYPSLLLPYIPHEGEVVALCSINDSNSEWMVIGLTGGSYSGGVTNI